jgi:hypothetical protein
MKNKRDGFFVFFWGLLLTDGPRNGMREKYR